MSVFERKTIGSFFKRLLPAVALASIVTTSVSNAEQLLLQYNAPDSRPVPEIALQTVKRTSDLCLSENGTLGIRSGGVLLSMKYSPPDGVINPQERIRIVQRQDCPAISGISLKVSFQF